MNVSMMFELCALCCVICDFLFISASPLYDVCLIEQQIDYRSDSKILGGVLYKRGRAAYSFGVKNWSSRFFTVDLVAGLLCYYESQGEMERGHLPRGRLSLPGAGLSHLDNDGEKKFCFELSVNKVTPLHSLNASLFIVSLKKLDSSDRSMGVWTILSCVLSLLNSMINGGKFSDISSLVGMKR